MRMIELPDIDLIKLVRCGDDRAFECLLSRYNALIKRLVKNYYVRIFDNDDFYQIAILAFYHAILTFEDDHGASFYTFALSCVRNKVISVWRQNREEIEFVTDYHDFLTVMQPCGEYDYGSEILAIMNNEKSFDQNARFEALLADTQLFTQLERDVLYGYLSGWKRKDIALAKGIDAHRVSQALYRVKTKMRDEGLRC